MRTYGANEIVELMRKGNFAQAEVHLRLAIEREPANPVALNFLGLIANAVNLPQFAIGYFNEAIRLAPDWQVPRINLEKTNEQLKGNGKIKSTRTGPATRASPREHDNNTERFLLIKAWGSGFWADVSHVLGQILVAEITGRIPVVHWGSNSLFGDGTGSNAFDFYFEPVSEASIDDLEREDFDFWPPKWNHRNLKEGALNQWAGPYSRVAGLYLLSRSENVIVGDFYTGVINLRPWISPDHHLYGLSINEIYRYLARRYLRPKKEILDKIDKFYQTHLATHKFISVHVRGSDKVNEMGAVLDDVNKQYKEIIDRYLSKYDCNRIFLMTDDSRVLEYFMKMYGDLVITTDCQRTSNGKGIHYHTVADRRRLGEEVIVDAYLAARGRAFIGNGFSNPSLIVSYLKNWAESDVYLHSLNINLTFNTFLHNW